jgi:hypothetical protein
MRQTQYDLAQRNRRNDVIDHPSRNVSHALAATARTKPAALARQRHQPPMAIGGAIEAAEAVREDAAGSLASVPLMRDVGRVARRRWHRAEACSRYPTPRVNTPDIEVCFVCKSRDRRHARRRLHK